MRLKLFRNIDWGIVGVLIFLAIISLAAIYSTAHLEYFTKQGIYFILGFFLMFLVASIDYRIFKNSGLVFLFYVLSVILLASVLVFGNTIRGVNSWIDLGFFRVQPVEIIKVTVVVLLAKYFSTRHVEIYHLKHIVISGIYILVPVFLTLRQPDIGSFLAILMVWVGIMIVSGIKKKHLAVLAVLGVVACMAGWMFVLKPYQKERIYTFVNPQADPLGNGYSVIQSMTAVGSGGILGKGVGLGSQSQLNFLPEQHTDFIFAVIAEEWGFMGVMLLLGLFSVLFYRLSRIIAETNDNFGKLYVVGIYLLFLCHIIVNIGMNIGLMPVTGIPLLLVSFGGSSVLSTFIALGIVQSIRVHKTFVLDDE